MSLRAGFSGPSPDRGGQRRDRSASSKSTRTAPAGQDLDSAILISDDESSEEDGGRTAGQLALDLRAILFSILLVDISRKTYSQSLYYQ